MKTKLFLLILFSLSVLACKERDADPNVLPAATQTGANTAGCLVDGKVWVATTYYLYPPGTYCENIGNKTKITLDLRQNKNSGSNSFDINMFIENLELNKTYTLSENSDIGYNAIYTDNNLVSYHTNIIYNGKLKITRLDIQNQIISGTFEFKAVDNNGNVVNITDGRFDKKFD